MVNPADGNPSDANYKKKEETGKVEAIKEEKAQFDVKESQFVKREGNVVEIDYLGKEG